MIARNGAITDSALTSAYLKYTICVAHMSASPARVSELHSERSRHMALCRRSISAPLSTSTRRRLMRVQNSRMQSMKCVKN